MCIKIIIKTIKRGIRDMMKKFILILTFCLWCLISNVQAKLYHGIDIDDIFAKSDWNSKDEIKGIIDDYTLLLQYNSELSKCADSHKLDCVNVLAEKIIKHFYYFNYDTNFENYQNYVKATFAAYGTIYCLNKYNMPSGTMCNQENESKTTDVITEYVKTLLLQVEQKIKSNDFILSYK